QRYIPLLAGQVERLVDELASAFPIATEFGSEKDSAGPFDPSQLLFGGLKKRTYIPAKADEISKYQDDYSKWKAACRTQLTNWHEALQSDEPLMISIEIENKGTRPA